MTNRMSHPIHTWETSRFDPRMWLGALTLDEVPQRRQTMPELLQIDFDDPVPLFPLPNCVLLPGATIPLHIFEQRYRAMMADAIDSRGLIAMALLEPEKWKSDYEGSPPLRPHVCVGCIVRHEKYPDGRYDILLQGICRARLIEEVSGKPFRLALLEPTEDSSVMEIDLSEQRHRLETYLRDPLLTQLTVISTVKKWLSREAPTVTLIDLTLMAVCDDLDDRYEMLVEADAMARFAYLDRLLRDLRRTVAVADRFKPSENGDGALSN